MALDFSNVWLFVLVSFLLIFHGLRPGELIRDSWEGRILLGEVEKESSVFLTRLKSRIVLPESFSHTQT